MFWNKLKSNEYLELHTAVERLRVSFEALKLDLELTRAKLRAKKGLVEKDQEPTSIKESVLLGSNEHLK